MFTRYGEEGALAGFTALLQALAAFAANLGDSIQSIRSAADGVHAAHQPCARIQSNMLRLALHELFFEIFQQPTVVSRRWHRH